MAISLTNTPDAIVDGLHCRSSTLTDRKAPVSRSLISPLGPPNAPVSGRSEQRELRFAPLGSSAGSSTHLRHGQAAADLSCQHVRDLRLSGNRLNVSVRRFVEGE